MATSRVWARFFHTGPDSQAKTCDLDPARLLSGFFSRGLDLPPSGPAGPIKGLGPIEEHNS